LTWFGVPAKANNRITNMIRYKLLIVTALAVSQFSLRAQISISYSGGPGESNVVNSAGLPFNGDTVSIGTFTNFDPTLPGNASDPAALQAHWLNFDSTPTRTIFGVDGRFAATSPGVNNALFDGQKIYLWVTEGSGNNITEYGLFSSTSADWVFAAHDAAIPPNPISSNQINQFLFGDGILGPGGATPGSLQTLAAVPEPTTFSLVALGLVILGIRARRR
jgi:hypothetical protein